MTCHVLHAGDGYTYLTRQVASADVQRPARDPLVEYYQAEGNLPGQWAGAGCVDLGVSGMVTEEHMLALFGEGLRPDANSFIAARVREGASFPEALADARLGRRFAQYDRTVPLISALKTAYTTFERTYGRRPSVDERRDIKSAVARSLLTQQDPLGVPPNRDTVRKYITDELGKARQPVAGFDLVFSPVKSVSVLWALGGHEIRHAVEGVHEAAWRGALAYGEREAAFTRTGSGGIAQVAVSGFVAATFQHRDSRAGDPDLHTHVAVSNRCLAADGKWRTLDSKQLHKVAVSMSETYNSLIEQGLVDRLGVRFVGVSKGAGKRDVREIEGMPGEWIRGFSRRRTQVEAGYDQLVRDYVRQYGQTPSRSVQMKLAQQAALENRPAKTELTSLAQQIADWRRHAIDLLPDADHTELIAGCVGRNSTGVSTAQPNTAVVATDVINSIAEYRATWTVFHVRSEAHRQLRPFVFPDATERERAIEAVVDHALGRDSVLLDIDVDVTPKLLQRPPDGESVFQRHGAQRYTSERILSAEDRLVSDAKSERGPVVTPSARRNAITEFERTSGKTLNAGQRALVEHFVSSGRALAVAIGPPGTGKSTAMRAVRNAWETTGGRVIGLTPSAAAASVLGDELGVRADTLHQLVTRYHNGADLDINRGDMLLVDEAGMAGTLILDQVRAIANERDAVMRLVGDHRQLTAVEAGGALRLIYHDASGTELSQIRRFHRPDEADAVLKFRVGDERALQFYAVNNRLTGGAPPVVLDSLYRDWQRDLETGRASIMISDSNDIARELSTRAQTERRSAGVVDMAGAELHDGNVAGAGDLIVTRRNRRRLTVLGGRDYVKNGDLWRVERQLDGGRLRVRHLRHGGAIALPGSYVAKWVELGYAATIHRSQGMTVDVSRSFLSPSTTREAALVALSRGTDGNYAYLNTTELLDIDEPHVLPGDLYYRHRETTATVDALRGILRHEGAEPSATEELRDGLDIQYRLSNLVPQYSYALQIHRGRIAVLEAEQWLRSALPDFAEAVLADEAWPALQQVLHEARDAGGDPVALLSDRALDRELDTAESVAKVLHYRVAIDMPTPRGNPECPRLLPAWIARPPAHTKFPAVADLPETIRNTDTARDIPAQELGGPGPAQLLLVTETDCIATSVTYDEAQLVLFPLSNPVDESPAQVPPPPLQQELGGPDAAQLVLFDETEPADPKHPEANEAQLALFSADDPQHQADLIELNRWIVARSNLIADRIRVLGERAGDRQPAWVAELGDAPADPAARDRWIINAGQTAAYRERWQIPDTITEMLPEHDRGEQGRARAWVESYLQQHPVPQAAAPAEPSVRAVRLREHLASIREGVDDRDPLSSDQLAQRRIPLDVQSDGPTSVAANDNEVSLQESNQEVELDVDPGM